MVPHTIRNSLLQDILPEILLLSQSAPSDNTTTKDDDYPKVIFVLGVSGGCDSVGLLHGMMDIVEPFASVKNHNSSSHDTTTGHPTTTSLWNLGSIPCHIHVVHFDHQLRGSASDGDRTFVKDLCKSYNLPLKCFYWNDRHIINNNHDQPQKKRRRTASSSSSKGKGDSTTINEPAFSQDSARQWRQSEMEAYIQNSLLSAHEDRSAVGVILTAHHRDDSMESWMLKFLRGTHITNLQGMSPVIQKDIQGTNKNNGGRTTNIVYYARPLLNVHKADIIDYLESRGWQWREDESNQSNKYLRNRVRNELLPLLSDLVGDQKILYKRLDNLSKQAGEINKDLIDRSRAYLSQQQQNISGDYFPIPESPMGIVPKNALYQWIHGVINDDIQLSYERLERVCEQIEREPDNQEWKLDLGAGWMIERKGSVLMVVSQDMHDPLKDTNNCPLKLSWTLHTDDATPETSCTKTAHLEISIPTHPEAQFDFVMSTVERLTKSQTFVGSWWDDARTPIPAGHFLRGQKVPLHRRGPAPVILFHKKNHELDKALVVAVYVESKETWMIHKGFVASDDRKPSLRVLVALPEEEEQK